MALIRMSPVSLDGDLGADPGSAGEIICISQLAWECLRILHNELESVAWDSKEYLLP